MIQGTTYSYREIEWRGGRHEAAFADLLALRPGLIRIGTYWSDIQPEQDTWHTDRLLDMLRQCQGHDQAVMVTVGAKGPRWPEFYEPSWVTPLNRRTAVLAYVDRLVTECAPFACITHWQVENEPLDPSGPDGRTIEGSLLEQEIAFVRAVDPRPIHLNVWGNTLSKRRLLPALLGLADSVGLDLYYQQPKLFGYGGPEDSDDQLRQIIQQASKPIWVAELQAEAWERRDQDKWTTQPRSIDATKLQSNIQRARNLGVAGVLLWGYEYWYWQRAQGYDALWRAATPHLSSNATGQDGVV